jgi:hypothetical protein
VWLQDIGQNNIELWNFKTGGGWIHPIHVHLVVRASLLPPAPSHCKFNHADYIDDASYDRLPY